ncbi:MAG: tetratricopeptide repeat protein [Dehalococcoidia bacterium]|nr:tetratricopeptide repeat protein [Dehalococcoidia bacterium]
MTLQPEMLAVGIAQGIIARLIVDLARVFTKDPGKDRTAQAVFVPRPPDSGFMGREGEKEAVVRGLRQNDAVLLCGSPGVGKSAIALAVAHEPDIQRHFGGRVLWITAPEATLDSLCTSILRQASMGEALKDLKGDQEKASVVRGALTQANTRVLFILDQADNAPGAGAFCQQVTSSVLVTSQQRISGLSCVDVQPFSGTKRERIMAEQLLDANAPRKLKRGEKQLLSTVARQCSYLPLALVLAGSQLHEGYTVQDLSLDLTERGLDPLADPVDSTNSVRATFDLAYQRLDPPLQKLFSCFGAFNLLEAPISRDAVLAACSAGQPRDLALLAARSLITAPKASKKQAAQSYTMHSLLWRYACEKLGGDPAPRARALDYFTNVARKHRQERWQHYREMDAALPHVFFLLRWAKEHADRDVSLKGAALLNVTPEFLDRRGYWEEWVEWGQWALNTARAAGNKPLIADSTHHLAVAFQNRGEMEGARALCDESLKIERELGNKGGIAVTLHQLGNLAYLQGDYAGARTLYDESLKIERELGNKDGIARTLHQLGNLAYLQDDHAGARKLYDESLTLERELGDKGGIAATLHQLGALAQDQDDHAGARKLYDESLTLNRELGSKGRIAVTLHELGRLAQAQAQGDYAEARRLYRGSLALKQELGDKDGIARTLHQLGTLAEVEKRTEEATGYYRRALAIFEELHSPDAEVARKALARVTGGKGGSADAATKEKT